MKNTIKRTLTVLLALMLVWAACSVATFAKDYDGTITASTETAKPGETVNVTITLGEHPGLVSLQIEVGYDADALTLTGVTDAGNLSTFEVDTNNLTPNPFTLTWNGDLLKSNITYTGVIATLTFKVKEDANPGDQVITIRSFDAMNYDTDDVFFNDVNGKVTVTHDHTWADEWSKDETNHWKACTAGDAKTSEAAHTFTTREENRKEPADCTTPGSYDLVTYCSVCGYVKSTENETIKAPGHKWAEAWKNDATQHWHICEVCGEIDTKADHSPEKTEVTVKEPTCVEYGDYYTADKCTVCGYETNKSDIMHTDPTGKHTWKETWESDDEGHWHICSVCDTTDKDSYADHTEGDKIIDKEATTETEGAWHTECTVCGKVIKTGSIDKLKVYEVTDGNKAVFKKGAKTGVKVTTKVPANGTTDIVVKVNGKVVDSANYEITGDNEVAVTLKPEYLETLAKGEYKLEVTDRIGVATSTFTVEEVKAAEDKSPKTGNPVLFWVLLALLANAVLVGSTVYRKKVR